MKNPEQANQIQNLMKNNGNPQELLKQTMSRYKPEQIDQFIKYANNMGFSTEQLSQYGINSKS
jgi:predicted flavoprotein YhiN